MKLIQACLSRIFKNGSITCYEFDSSHPLIVQPGQFITARGEVDILPIPFFPSGMQGSYFSTVNSEPHAWQPGVLLSTRFPLGKGFSIPASTKRLLMICGTTNPLRLLPVAGRVLEAGGEAALFTENIPGQISPEIELLTRDELAGAVTWADGIIADSAFDQLSFLKSLISGAGRSPGKKAIQVLVETPIVCAGTADCGVCAVKTRRGWQQACTDGPVFLLDELDS